MTRARTCLLALGSLACLATAPAPARAWTEASVRSAAAQVDVGPDGTAQIRLVLNVRVSAGWLEGFEVAGLDPDLVLNASRPAVFRDASGASISSRVEDQGEGRVTFAFRRRDAPRRGEYQAELSYTTQLAHRSTEVAPGGRVRVRWTLPGWRSGLDSPSIVLTVPGDAELVVTEGDAPGLEVQTSTADGRTRFALQRVHLPRTREWTVAVDVPQAAMDPALLQLPEARGEASTDEGSGTPASSHDGSAHGDSARDDGASGAVPRADAEMPEGAELSPLAEIAAEPETPSPLAYPVLALLVTLLLLLRAWRIERAEQSARVDCAAWVPMPPRLRMGGIASLGLSAALSAVLLGPAAADALLVLATLLVLRRRAAAPRAARLGTFRPSTSELQRAARRAAWTARLDPSDGSTPFGALLLALLVCTPLVLAFQRQLPVALHHALICVALVALAMLRGTRLSRPQGPLEALHTLVRWASRQQTIGTRPIALRPMVHVGVRQDLQEARMRVVLNSMPKGLLRLDVTLGFGANHDHWDVAPLLLLVARRDSATDRALAEALPGTPRLDAGRRRARIVPLDGDLSAALEPILDALAKVPSEAPYVSLADAEPLRASA